ncbi:GTPase IMAP family member 1-like [Anas platyrhynchos]|uniref:GTPase IMAP family member 1-like n=1 Tax=Anas platyrhynchos TaxID=8839 RepID=UPI003AF250AD
MPGMCPGCFGDGCGFGDAQGRLLLLGPFLEPRRRCWRCLRPACHPADCRAVLWAASVTAFASWRLGAASTGRAGSVSVAIQRVLVLPGFGEGLEMRLILAGKAGGGKSATGNTLLGQRVFESKLSTKPVTVSCARAQGHWDGEDFTVVDTADIFNPGGASSEVHQEIIRCIRLSSPGPHALLLVTQLGRFTQEDEEAAERLQDIFGADVFRHTIVIFTRAEELGERSLHDYVSCTDNKALRKLIERCGKRYCGFNNRAAGAERDHQVMELMGMVHSMVQENGDRYYSNEMYLEPNLTEEKVAYHMARYRAGRIKREQSGRRTVVVACGLFALTVAVISLGYYIMWVRGVPAPRNR